jgi:hypothetical protein
MVYFVAVSTKLWPLQAVVSDKVNGIFCHSFNKIMAITNSGF